MTSSKEKAFGPQRGYVHINDSKTESTTSFNEWLENEDVTGIEDIYTLYKSIDSRADYGRFCVRQVEDRTIIISKNGDLALVLASDKAREAFFDRIKAMTGEHATDIEAWYQSWRANKHF